jgi:putative transposase
MSDHAHMMISIPPKYAVSQVAGFIERKSAIHLAWVYGERKRNFVGQYFWARVYFESTVGRAEAVIRGAIRNQEKEDQRLDQFSSPALSHLQVAQDFGAASATPPCKRERSITLSSQRRFRVTRSAAA